MLQGRNLVELHCPLSAATAGKLAYASASKSWCVLLRFYSRYAQSLSVLFHAQVLGLIKVVLVQVGIFCAIHFREYFTNSEYFYSTDFYCVVKCFKF